MKAGLYYITRDVENPTPDRRSKEWGKRPVWKKGTLVALTAHYTGGDEATWVHLSGSYVHQGCKLLPELAAALDVAPIDSANLVYKHHREIADNYGTEIGAIQVLIESGKITLADFAEALNVDSERPFSE